MADSTMIDLSKMKVVDLRKELKNRGLSYTGDKAELTARLQVAMNQDSQDQDEHGDINLDSDEIDSDGVLDEDDKSQNDILDDTISEELALADQPEPKEPEKPVEETKPQRTLKRKITMSDTSKETKSEENQTGKKIVLHRTSVTASAPKEEEKTSETKPEPATEDKKDDGTDNKVKISTNMDVKTRLELRAKRFGLPVKMTDDQRKEARKQRFGGSGGSTIALAKAAGLPVAENIDKLKQRSERFGQSVSKFMTDIENIEKIEKRKAKFGTVK